MATYAIGDVQGCYDELRRLIDRTAFDPSQDRLLFVGDLVNRGPKSLEVLRFVKQLGASATTVLGNHDLHLLMLSEGYGEASRDDTLDDILGAPDRDELLAWLRTRPLCHLEQDRLLVHAGLLPQWSASCARALAQEVESGLASPDYREFLARMRGNEPAFWSEDLAGWDRLRVIVNAMTRMRICTPAGLMDMRFKGPPSRAPAGYVPWFEVPDRASGDHTVICGHWSALGLRMEERLIALDTGCVWGGKLTAICLSDCKSTQPRLFEENADRQETTEPGGAAHSHE